MVLRVGKFLEMVDAVMDKTACVQFVVADQAIGINNTIRHDFLYNNRHQSIGLSIIYGNSLDPSVAFQNAEDNNFPCHTVTALAVSPEITFIQLDRALKNLIGSQNQMMADARADFAVEQFG